MLILQLVGGKKPHVWIQVTIVWCDALWLTVFYIGGLNGARAGEAGKVTKMTVVCG